jgi:preprotein translocase subunit SecE
MNRQQRRLAQRQGEVTEEGLPPAPTREPSERKATRPAAGAPKRTSPRQFLHEVNVELRKVAWPTRAETTNYAVVVFITLAVLMALIFVLDLFFGKFANFLFS